LENRSDDLDIPVMAGVRELPQAVPAEFPCLEPPEPGDLTVFEKQLGRPPRGEVFVACRCPRGRLAVLLTVPALAADGRTPPLLWLTCPHAAIEASRLESGGFIKGFARRLESDPGAREVFLVDEERFARMLALLSLSAGGRELAERVGLRGVAGGARGGVKCLHAHIAYHLATARTAGPGLPGPGGRGLVGRWCIDEIEKRGGTWCEEIPQACVD